MRGLYITLERERYAHVICDMCMLLICIYGHCHTLDKMIHSMKNPKPFQMGSKSAPGPSHEVVLKQHSWILAMHRSLFGLGLKDLKAHVWFFGEKCLQSFIPRPYCQPHEMNGVVALWECSYV